MTRPYVAPGHRLTDEDWAAVQARAKEVREQVAADAQGGASGPGGIIVDMTARGLASKKYFGVSGIPTQLGVLHSAECPLQAGYAISLSEWASATVHPAPPTASWQRFVDPIHRVRLIPDHLGAWHASEANVLSVGWEQAGYARYTRAEWLTADGQAQMDLLAYDMAEVAVRDGLEPRWLSDWEVRQVLDAGNRTIKGFCFHRQIDPDTRTDPGNGYPADLLMDRIKTYMAGAPAPTPTPEEDPEMLTIYRDTSAADPGKTWIGNALGKRHVVSPKMLEDYQKMAREGKMSIAKDGQVQILPDYLFGPDIYAKPATPEPAPVTVSLTPEHLKALGDNLAADLARRLAD